MKKFHFFNKAGYCMNHYEATQNHSMNILSLKNHNVKLAAAHYDVQTFTFCSTAVCKLSADTTVTAKNFM
jgi:hypothetical protein